MFRFEESARSPTPSPTSTSFTVRVAGILSFAAWGLLAWRPHAGVAPLFWLLGVLGFAWFCLLLAWRSVTRNNSTHVLIFGVLFRAVAFFAVPVLEDDHYRFLWDGYRFATTGDPYSTAP